MVLLVLLIVATFATAPLPLPLSRIMGSPTENPRPPLLTTTPEMMPFDVLTTSPYAPYPSFGGDSTITTSPGA
jgi:hypothetical protein